MSEAGGDWRDGSAYDFIDTLAPEQLPFEFLRRNPDYVAEYPGRATEPDDEVPPPALARWGLRFRRRPCLFGAASSVGVVTNIRRRPADPRTCSVSHLVRTISRTHSNGPIGARG